MRYTYRLCCVILLLIGSHNIQLSCMPFFFISQERDCHIFEPELATLTPVFSTENYYQLKLSSNIIVNQLIPLMRTISNGFALQKPSHQIIEELYALMIATGCHENLHQLAKIILAADELNISLLEKAGINYLIDQYINYTPNELQSSLVEIYRSHKSGRVSPINMLLSKKNYSSCNSIFRQYGLELHHNAMQYYPVYHQLISYHHDPIIACACNSTGGEIAMFTQQGIIRLMNPHYGLCNYNVQLPLSPEDLTQSTINFARDNQSFFILAPTQLWIQFKQYPIQPFDVSYLSEHGRFNAATFSPCSTCIAAAVNNNIYLIDLTAYQPVLLYTVPPEQVCTTLIYTADGLDIISGSTNGIIEIRDGQSGNLKSAYNVEEPIVAICATKQHIAVLTKRSQLYLFDAKLDFISSIHLSEPIVRPQFSQDGLRIMGLLRSSNGYHQVGIFDTQSGALCQVHQIINYGQIYPSYTFHADNWHAFISNNNAIELFEMPCFKNQQSELKFYQLLFILLCKKMIEQPQFEYSYHHPKIMKSILASFDDRMQQFLWRQYHEVLRMLCDYD